MQTVSLWSLGVFKLLLWFLVLVALWLTLWARQLRKADRPWRMGLCGSVGLAKALPGQGRITGRDLQGGMA